MAQPEAANTIKQWMERLADAASEGRVVETSAGAGPQFDYAYLHFRTLAGEHSALVLRAVLVNGQPQVRVVQVDGDVDQIAELVDEATHGQAA
jgi:hypothetical protein